MLFENRDYLRIVLAVPLVALIALFVSLYHIYSEALTLAKDQLAEQQLLLARQRVVNVRKTVELLVRELRWLAREPATTALDLEGFRAIAEESFRYVKLSHVNDIALLDAEGVVRVPLRAPHLAGRDFSYRSYFRKARASTALSPCYELIDFQGVDAGEKGIVIAMPVRSSGEEVRGVVLFTIIANELIRGLSEPDAIRSRSWVMDGEGSVIYHPDHPTGTALPQLPALSDSYRAFLAMGMRGQSGKAEYRSPEGRRTIASSYPMVIADETWSYVVASDEAVAREFLAPFTVDYAMLTGSAFLLVLAGSAALFWRFSRWNRELESTVRKRTADLEGYREKLQSLASELSLTAGRERRSIATELHDRIGQSLALLRIRLGALRQKLSPGDLATDLDEARILVKQTIEDARSLTFELSPPILDDLGLAAAVEWLAEEMVEHYGIAVEIDSDGFAEPLEADLRDLLFQAVRELLLNVVKHSGARRVAVGLRRVDGTVRATVEDDGAGFDPSVLGSHRGREGGFGLFSIQERLAFSGGRLEIESQPGRGTRATLVAPLRRRRADADGGPR